MPEELLGLTLMLQGSLGLEQSPASRGIPRVWRWGQGCGDVATVQVHARSPSEQVPRVGRDGVGVVLRYHEAVR